MVIDKKRILYTFLLVFTTASVFSQHGGGGEDRITAVSVLGLKRTKPLVAEQRLKKFLGAEVSSLDLNEVRALILDTGILEPVSVEIEEDPQGGGKLLAVEVHEKWAIIPLPVFFIDSGGNIMAGGAFMDTNAFGLNDKLILGGLYRSSGWTAMGMYAFTPERDYMPGLSVAGLYSRTERKDTDQKNNEIRRFDLDSLSASLSISYPHWEIITPSVRVSYNMKRIRDQVFLPVPPFILPPFCEKRKAQTIDLSPGLSLRKSYWDGYLSSEKSLELQYTAAIGIDYPSSHSVSLKGTLEQAIIPGFKIGLRTGLRYDPEATFLFESSPSAAVNILPGSFSARSYAGLSAELEKYIYKFSIGTLSILASYQVVWSEGPILGIEFDHGAAAALRFYLSRLAFPALGIGAAYNVSAQKLFMNFSLGMSF
jgi:hypothetical protein